VPANEWGMEIWNEPITYKKGAAYLGAGFTIKTLNDGLHRRDARHRPEDRQDRLGSPNNAPLWGGVLTTGGNLVFWGTPEGFLKAADAKTGKEVWKFQTGSGVVAPPVTWDRTASSTSPWPPAGAAPCRCGAATWPRR
jgi:alcohol dehydrogenase (cytochrome c)